MVVSRANEVLMLTMDIGIVLMGCDDHWDQLSLPTRLSSFLLVCVDVTVLLACFVAVVILVVVVVVVTVALPCMLVVVVILVVVVVVVMVLLACMHVVVVIRGVVVVVVVEIGREHV